VPLARGAVDDARVPQVSGTTLGGRKRATPRFPCSQRERRPGAQNGAVKTDPELLFEAVTPLGFTVRVTRERWNLIATIKHPVMLGHEGAVKQTLESPEQVRQSRSNPHVLLFYRAAGEKRWVCAVTKHATDQGFLITAYPTDAVKEGMQIWPK
jgi:hypothetical protein